MLFCLPEDDVAETGETFSGLNWDGTSQNRFLTTAAEAAA